MAVLDSIIQLPLDTGNTGKMKRTQTRTVGANTVHTDYVIVEDPRELVGVYKCSSGVLTVPIAVHNGTTTGFAWLSNPIGSNIAMYVNRLTYKQAFTALAVDLLVGELETSRFTFTGVNSGVSRTPAKIDSNHPAAQGQMFTSFATAVSTLGSEIESTFYLTMPSATPTAVSEIQLDEWIPTNAHEELILRPGEGIVVWHAAAVTTANRRLLIIASWDEVLL
jgi:hypothetical protein